MAEQAAEPQQVEDFFRTNDAPVGLDGYRERVREFVAFHVANNRRIALVSVRTPEHSLSQLPAYDL